MCRLVVGLTSVTGQGGERSRDEKPNGYGSHQRTQDKAKTDKANDCEPSREASLFGVSERMAETVVVLSCIWSKSPRFVQGLREKSRVRSHGFLQEPLVQS